MRFLCFYSFFVLLLHSACCSRIRDSMYQTLDARYSCFKIMNGTHQFGCSGAVSGNTGIVFVVNSTEHWQHLLALEDGLSYIVVLVRHLFTVDRLHLLQQTMTGSSAKATVNGVILALFQSDFSHETTKNLSFSEDTKCPNHLSGFYSADKYSDQYNYCLKKPWNPSGTSLLRLHWPFPIILLNNDTQLAHIYQCASDHSSTAGAWPRCALRLYTPMMAAGNSRVCWRRSQPHYISQQAGFCSPIGSHSVVARLGAPSTTAATPPSPAPAAGGSRVSILVVAHLDGATVFDMLAPGADSAVVGAVALLAVAASLTKVAHLWQDEDDAGGGGSGAEVMFALFSGESFDYIGSERFVYDSSTAEVKADVNDEAEVNSSWRGQVNISRLTHVIELGQLTGSPSHLTLHSDPVTRTNYAVNSKVKAVVAALKNAASANLTVEESPDNVPLPPSSLHSLLKARADLAVVLLADHQESFTNRFYHSVYDNAEYVGWSEDRNSSSSSALLNHIVSVANITANAVLQLVAANQSSEHTTAVNDSLVAELLDCYLLRSNCSAFRRVLSPQLADPYHTHSWLDSDAPLPTYVSAYVAETKHWYLVQLTSNVLASLIGDTLTNITDIHSCKPQLPTDQFVYRWLLDRSVLWHDSNSDIDSSGYCVKSLVWLTPAVSPAFSQPDYDWDSGRFSTWTESRWLSFSLQMFLVPSPLHEWLHLAAGLLTTLLLSALILVVVKNADFVFSIQHNSSSRTRYEM